MRLLSRLAFAVTVSLSLSLASCTPPIPPHALPGAVTVSILDVGQGDAILVRSPEGKTAPIDAGQSSKIVSTLEHQGVNALDLVVVSHHHADHYGGMNEVIRAFHPRIFLASSSSHTSPAYLKLLQLGRDRGIPAIGPLQTPRKIELGTVVLTVFPQAPDDPKEENNNSIGIRVEYGNFSMLLPGDAQTQSGGGGKADGSQPLRRCHSAEAGPSRQSQRDRLPLARPGPPPRGRG